MPKARFIGGRQPKITPEIVDFVGALVAKGMPLYRALALVESHHYTVEGWNTQMQRRPILSARFEKIVAQWMSDVLDDVAGKTMKTLPAEIWLLERRHPNDFAIKPGQTNVNVNVNTVIGLGDDVIRRAAGMVKRQDRVPRVPFKQKELDGVKQTVDLAASDVSVTQGQPVTPTDHKP